MARARPRRWKVQRRADLWARDRSDVRFLLGTYWRTVNQADTLVTAEKTMLRRMCDNPSSEFRLVEEWPIGTTPRVRFVLRKKMPKRSLT